MAYKLKINGAVVEISADRADKDRLNRVIHETYATKSYLADAIAVAVGELEYYYQVKQVLISAGRLQYLQEAWESRHQIIVDANGNVTGVTGTLNDIVIPIEALRIPDSELYTSPFYPHRASVKSLTLPNGLRHIGARAFQYCSGLTGSLIVPNSVTSIGTRAFDSCSGFTKVVFEGQAPPINRYVFSNCTAILEYDFTNCTTVPALSSTNAFYNINANCRILVPATLEAAWKAATNWVTYADKIVGV